MKTLPALIIFVRNPVLGKVKTRLAASMGAEKALEIYLELCRLTREQCQKIPFARYLYYSDWIEEVDDWSADFFHKRLQTGVDLGERMQHAFVEVLADHPAALIIGTDCPALDADLLQKAVETLQDHDAVLGPAADGGYYLLGLKKAYPALFSGIPWSTAEVAQLTLEKMRHLGLVCARLKTLSDIDEAEDWEKWREFAVVHKR
jgi:uncharacterized protein